MDAKHAAQIVLDHLWQAGKLTNTEILRLLGGNDTLLREVREILILDDLAQDKAGAGLILSAPNRPEPESQPTKPKVFLSYGRRDAKDLADRLARDLKALDFEVWQDTAELASGTSWQHEITDGLRSAQIVIALLSPHAVRTSRTPGNPDGADSVCLGEIAYALFQPPSKPIVPVMAEPCEPPLAIFHLDYVDLTRWRDSEDQYRAGFDRLVKAIEAAQRGEKRYRSWHHQLQPWDFASFLHEKRRDFTGREWLFDEIDAWRVSTKHERALLITGDPGTGKSAIVAELVHRNPGGQVVAYHCCQADTPATLESWRFVRSIAAMIASRMPEYAARLEDPSVRDMLSEEACRQDPAGALERGVLCPLETLPAPLEGVRYLLVDALDEALVLRRGLTVVQLLASRINRLPNWLRIVATTRKDPQVLNSLRGLRAQELDAQDPRNQADVKTYVCDRLDSPNLQAAISHSQVGKSAVFERLIEKSAGNFLYIRQALDAIESGTYSLEKLETLPTGLYGLYDAFFQRQFGSQSSDFAEAKRVLEVVVAAQEPLTIEELSHVTGLHLRRQLPVILHRLAAYVPGRPDGFGKTTYAVFHKSLADWLTAPDLLGTPFSVLPEDGHQQLASWGVSEYRDGAGQLSEYSLRHLTKHLIASSQWEHLETLFTDLSYFERRNEAGQLFELVLDLNLAIKALPAHRSILKILRLLLEALRRDLHFIARHAKDYPQVLFQCLWNAGWWYDCPQAADCYDPPDQGWPSEGPPWQRQGLKLFELMQRWREKKERLHNGFRWLRMVRPPSVPLGSPLTAVWPGHTREVFSVAFSPDGTQVISGSQDGTIRIWDAANGAELAVLRGHAAMVNSVAYSPDGSVLVSGSADKTIRVWDTTNGAELLRLNGHQDFVASVAFSRDGRQILSGSGDRTVRVWDAASGLELIKLSGHDDGVRCAKYSPDGNQIVSGSEDGTVRVWELDGTLQTILHGHQGWIADLDYAPDKKRIITGSWDATVRIWDPIHGMLKVLEGHDQPVTSLVATRNGKILTGSSDNTIRLWDLESGTPLAVIPEVGEGVNCLALSPDGLTVVSGSVDQRLRIWNLENEMKLANLKGHEDVINGLAHSPDGRRIVSGSSDKTVRVWDAESGIELAILRGHQKSVSCVDFSEKRLRVASGSADKSIRIWDFPKAVATLVLRGHQYGVTSVGFSPDGLRVVSGSYDKTVRVWDADQGVQLAEFHGHENWVTSVAFAPDGLSVVSGSWDRSVRIWNLQRGTAQAVLWGHQSMITRVQYSPDCRYILSKSWDKEERIWDALTGECIKVLQAFGTESKSQRGDVLDPSLGECVFASSQERSHETAERFPLALNHLTKLAFGSHWAGASQAELIVLEFRGDEEHALIREKSSVS